MSPRDRLLVGIDLRKEPEVLHAAYNDAQGVTARFNKNILVRINRELGGCFDVDRFDHQAVYNDPAGRIEMYLRSRCDQDVRIAALNVQVDFRADELIHTENSYKYSSAEVELLLKAANLSEVARWTDTGARFLSVLMAPLG